MYPANPKLPSLKLVIELAEFWYSKLYIFDHKLINQTLNQGGLKKYQSPANVARPVQKIAEEEVTVLEVKVAGKAHASKWDTGLPLGTASTSQGLFSSPGF